MRLNHLLTTEMMDKARIEAQTKTRINFDEYLADLIDLYYEANSQTNKNNAEVEINATLDRMKRDSYSEPCRFFYATLFRYVKETTDS